MNIKKLIPKISEEEMIPLVIRLLEINQLLMEEVQNLKDEIAGLKGQKPRPEIKPSSITKEDSNKQESGKTNSGGARRAETKDIRIHQDIKIPPDNIPPGSKFIDYRDYIVQDIKLFPGTYDIAVSVGKHHPGSTLQESYLKILRDILVQI